MAAVIKWCVLGLLVLVCVASHPTPPSDKKCVFITLRSTLTKPAKEAVKDKDGKPADIVSVNIETSLSKVKCELGDTLDIAEPFVIAKKGCSAQLKVCYIQSNEPDPTVRPGCMLIRFLSRLNREVKQTLNSSIVSMKVVRQYPQGVKCEFKETFGFKDKIAYAKKGCRGDFEVCTKEQSGSVDCDVVELKSTFGRPQIRKISDRKGKPVDIISMELIKQISSFVDCVQWMTFFFSDTSVIAKRGCHGKFKVCYKRKGTGSKSGCIKIQLKSTINKSDRKTISIERKSFTIRVLDEFSGIKCVRNENYGIRGNSVFATGGCRGEFEICPSH